MPAEKAAVACDHTCLFVSDRGFRIAKYTPKRVAEYGTVDKLPRNSREVDIDEGAIDFRTKSKGNTAQAPVFVADLDVRQAASKRELKPIVSKR